jgi:DNA-binding NtrC family response regulator
MKHRILIADDDEAARSGLADLLSSWGYEVEQAIDGKDALEKAPEFGPAVVIADLVMPALDGVALLKPLAEIYPNAVVILLTGHATVETAVSAMREGAYDYLTKPVDPRRLRVLLDKAVERGQCSARSRWRQPGRAGGFGPSRGRARPCRRSILIELAGASSAP